MAKVISQRYKSLRSRNRYLYSQIALKAEAVVHNIHKSVLIHFLKILVTIRARARLIKLYFKTLKLIN